MYSEYKAFIDKLEELCSGISDFTAVKVGVLEEIDSSCQATIVPEGWAASDFTTSGIIEEYRASIWVHRLTGNYTWGAVEIADKVIKAIENDPTLGGVVDTLHEVNMTPSPLRERSVVQITIKAQKVVTYV